MPKACYVAIAKEIAVRLRQEGRITPKDIKRDYGVGDVKAGELAEHALEFHVRWQLSHFPPPRRG